MIDGDTMLDHLNAFGIVVGQLAYVDIKMFE